MNKTIAIGVAVGLAVLAGCGNKADTKEEVKVEYAPRRLSIKEGDTTFHAYVERDSCISANLWYTNNKGQEVRLMVEDMSIQPASVSYIGIRDSYFEIRCDFVNPPLSEEEKELCSRANLKLQEKCNELQCNSYLMDWLKKKPSLADWYL